MYNTTHTLSRIAPRADSTSPKLSRTTTIIVAVVASLVALALAAFLARLLRGRCTRRTNAAPLPPVQPLAHRREHTRAAFPEYKGPSRQSTWSIPSAPSRPRLHPAASAASLLPGQGPPLRQSSFNTETADGSDDMSPLSPSASENAAHPLAPPVPSFYPPSRSNSSLASSPGPATAPPTRSASPTAILPASPSHPTARPSPRPRPRPYSTLSTATSHSGSVPFGLAVRAAPHAPHNHVQLVMPAPLAPEVYPYILAGAHAASMSTLASASSDRLPPVAMGLTDKWVMVARTTAQAGARASTEARRGATADVPAPRPPPRRSSSNPPPTSRLRHSTSSSAHQQLQQQQQQQPQVPRMPSLYSDDALAGSTNFNASGAAASTPSKLADAGVSGGGSGAPESPSFPPSSFSLPDAARRPKKRRPSSSSTAGSVPGSAAAPGSPASPARSS